jgi:Tfp pilus assembly protein PilF
VHFKEALRIQPDLAEASNNLGVLLCRTGRTEEGIQRIEAALRAQPGFAQAHFSRGMALLQMGRRDEAIAEFEKVLKLQPDDPSARRMLQLIQSPR